MTWNKREPTGDLVVLGNDEAQVEKIAGLLASTRQDSRYPSRLNYELVQKDGNSLWLAGSASLGGQIAPGDIGAFIACRFLGWGTSRNGKFKEIDVRVWTDDPPPKGWEVLGERAESLRGGNPVVKLEDEPAEDDSADDDLPF